MNIIEPSAGEIKVTLAVTNTVGAPFYSRYVRSMKLSGDERILDFGSGSGAVARFAARELMRGKGRLTCLDISQRWMDVTRDRLKKYPNVDYKYGPIEDCDIPTSSFDIAIIHFVLHEIEKGMRVSTVKKIASTLKTGGRIYIREPIGVQHGMEAREIRDVIGLCSMEEKSFEVYKSFLAGTMARGIFIKK